MMDRANLPYDAMVADEKTLREETVTLTEVKGVSVETVETGVEIPVSVEDLTRFYKTQIRRTKRNLTAARQRGDLRAVTNINHKILIYKETINRVNK